MKKIIAFVCVIIVAGCSDTTQQENYFQQGFNGDQEAIISTVEQEKKIQQIQIVGADNITLVTYEVKLRHRFQKQAIEKDLKKKLAENFSDVEFVVSGDYKLHYEAEKLLKDKDDRHLVEEIEKLKKLAEEET